MVTWQFDWQSMALEALNSLETWDDWDGDEALHPPWSTSSRNGISMDIPLPAIAKISGILAAVWLDVWMLAHGSSWIHHLCTFFGGAVIETCSDYFHYYKEFPWPCSSPSVASGGPALAHPTGWNAQLKAFEVQLPAQAPEVGLGRLGF